MVALGWLLSVAVATMIGLAAVSLLSEGLIHSSMTPLRREAIAKALASATPSDTSTHNSSNTPSTAPTPALTNSQPTNSATITRSLASPGGTVIARCEGKSSYLLSWIPAQGWSVEEHQRGPAESTFVKFEGDTDALDDQDVIITVTCPAGEPIAAVIVKDD